MTREERMERIAEIRETDGWIVECENCLKMHVYYAESAAPPDLTLEDGYCPLCGQSGVEVTAFMECAPSDLRALLDVAEAAEAFAGHFGSDGMEMLASDDAWDDFNRLRNALDTGEE